MKKGGLKTEQNNKRSLETAVKEYAQKNAEIAEAIEAMRTSRLAKPQYEPEVYIYRRMS